VTIEPDELSLAIDARLEEILADARHSFGVSPSSSVEADRDATIIELRRQVRALNRELASTSEEQVRLTIERDQLARTLDHRSSQVADAESMAAALRGALNDADAEVAELQGRLATSEADRDRRLRALRWELCAHERELEQLQRQLRDETAMAESLTAELARVERRLSLRATQLQAIRGSRSFRFATRASAIKYALIHPRRARRRLQTAEVPAELRLDA
jgi:chromosome segregation ATPase